MSMDLLWWHRHRMMILWLLIEHSSYFMRTTMSMDAALEKAKVTAQNYIIYLRENFQNSYSRRNEFCIRMSIDFFNRTTILPMEIHLCYYCCQIYWYFHSSSFCIVDYQLFHPLHFRKEVGSKFYIHFREIAFIFPL